MQTSSFCILAGWEWKLQSTPTFQPRAHNCWFKKKKNHFKVPSLTLTQVLIQHEWIRRENRGWGCWSGLCTCWSDLKSVRQQRVCVSGCVTSNFTSFCAAWILLLRTLRLLLFLNPTETHLCIFPCEGTGLGHSCRAVELLFWNSADRMKAVIAVTLSDTRYCERAPHWLSGVPSISSVLLPVSLWLTAQDNSDHSSQFLYI